MKFYISSIDSDIELTEEEIEYIYRYQEKAYRRMDAKDHISDIFSEEDDESYLEHEYGTSDMDIVLNDEEFIDYCVEQFNDSHDCNLPENDLWENVLKEALKTYSNKFYHCEKQSDEEHFSERQKKEAIHQMSEASFSKQLIESFKNGKILASDEIGKLRPLTDFEKQVVEKFEEQYGTTVFHVLKSNWFMDMICFLFVSKYEEDWEDSCQDLKDHTPLAWAYNLQIPDWSEFGSIGIKESGYGGFIRTH